MTDMMFASRCFLIFSSHIQLISQMTFCAKNMTETPFDFTKCHSYWYLLSDFFKKTFKRVLAAFLLSTFWGQ